MENEVQVYSITDEYMKSHHVKTLWYQLVENLIYFLCIYPIVAIVNYIVNENENMLYLNLLSILPVFFMTYLRHKIKTLSKFILFIVLVSAMWLTILVHFNQYVFILVPIIWTIISMRRSIVVQRFDFNKYKLLLAETLLIPQIIFAAGLQLNKFQIFICFISIFIMCISIAYICKARNKRLSLDDIENESFNRKDSNIFIGGTILLICIILFVLYKSGVFDWANYVTNKISRSLPHTAKESIDSQNNNFQISSGGNYMNGLYKLGNGNNEPPGILAKAIFLLLDIIGAIIIISASYLALNRLLIYIKMLKNKDKVTFVFTNKNEGELKEKINKIKREIRKSLFLTDREKIRRFYKNKILKYKRNNIIINNSSSTCEIQKEVLHKASENIADITKVYEKARYSNEEITEKDMDVIKKYKK
ncbi:hypothetical protein [Clostridium sp. C2-6-12]|uniref:hypothetical protein n=1 Tax=Clostridium sp. C2-6-12 TaxID=2698832 RepID=UPI001A9AC6B8|nr:hypothetical protein [Clostridium sp. C2-6-12]